MDRRVTIDLDPTRPVALWHVPFWVKLGYSAFAAFAAVVLAASSPWSFLWFCNAAILLTLVGVWVENRLLLSMQHLAIFWADLFWQADCVARILWDARIFAACGLTPAEYMWDPFFPRWHRLVSLQHAWMLYFLLWLIWRLGYDRRALAAQTLYAWGLLLLTAVLVRDFGGPAGNVNHIFGPSGDQPQRWMPHWTWVVFLMIFVPVCHYGPLHFVFRRLFRPGKGRDGDTHDEIVND